MREKLPVQVGYTVRAIFYNKRQKGVRMDTMRFLDCVAMLENEYRRLLEQHPELERLSKREMEVFIRLLSDKTQMQIAQELYISHSSVHFHCKNIYKKLNINSRKQLLIRYKDF